jgi:hypothetical protein
MRPPRILLPALLAVLAAFLTLESAPVLAASTITVDSTADTNTSDTVLTLREAMLLTIGGTGGNGTTTGLGRALNASEADNVSGAPGAASVDTIIFADPPFPASTPATISIGTALPQLTAGNEVIDAVTPSRGVIVQGNVGHTLTCVDLASAGNTVRGLRLTDCQVAIRLLPPSGDNNTVGPGNVITDSTTGITTGSGASGNSIVGNKIGTNAAGTAIAPEGANGTGIQLFGGNNNTIGGSTAANRNIISGNSTGLQISTAAATGNVIKGNFIGTDVNGTADLGNGNGIFLSGGTTNNTIGGTIPGEANLVSGNVSANITLTEPGTSSNTLRGNIVGPDLNLNGATMGNGDGVVIMSGASNNAIGPRNVISDNLVGAYVQGSGTTGNAIRGNFIGTNLSGNSAVPNSLDGVRIDSSAASNTIGGTTPGDGNVIAHNTGDGVEVNGSATTGNAVRGNSIHSNTGLEINNVAGGNLELLPPTITSTAFGTVSGIACTSCTVDIFSDPSTDSRFYEGSVTAAGDGSFVFVNGGPFIEPNVTATNTDAAGNTSRLSSFFAIDSDADGTPDNLDADDDNDGMEDAQDACRVFPEDYDGFQDADGCPESDNDLDGICDTGQTSTSCTGADSGQTAFYPPGHNHTSPTIDCRNTPEDFDSFKDSDGCPEGDNDNDSKPDSNDTCPGNDNVMGADGALGVGGDQNHNGLVDGGETWAPLGTSGNDDSVRTYEDYDGILDTDGCHDSPCDDVDGDSFGLTLAGCPLFADEREAVLGTNSVNACADTPGKNKEDIDPWPLDTDDDGFVDTGDIASLTGRFGQAQVPSNVRYDLNLSGFIDTGDIALVTGRFGQTCVPPGPLG